MPGRSLLPGLVAATFFLAPSKLLSQEPSPRPPLLQPGGETGVDLTARADGFFSRGKLTEAADSYRETLDSDAGDVSSLQRNRFLLACLLFELGSFADSKKEFETIYRADEKAVASEMFARLCDRRIDRPAEPLAGAIEGVVVPYLLEGKRDAIAWNDPVMEGLMGEALLRGGPMYLSPRAFGPVIEEHAEDPEFLLGCSQFLPRTQRTGLLEIARKRFPESAPLQLATFFSIRFTRTTTAKWQALEALGAAILADPVNAFPRYLRFGIEQYKTQRDPDTGTLPPYSPEMLAELERYNGFEKFDTCSDRSIAAGRRVLTELGHPFQISLIQANVESGLILNNILQRLAATVKAMLEAGDLEGARKVSGIAETIVKRWTARSNSSSIRATTAASASIMLAHFARYHEAHGDAEIVEEISRRQREYQALALDNTSNSLWPSIAIVPIPQISNLAVERLLSPPRQ